MTNEYATKVLKRIQYGTTYPVYEALNMAIETLNFVSEHHQSNIETYAHDMGVSLEQAERELRVEELSCSEKPNRSDLISRQAAINSFRYDDDGTAWDVDDIVYRLEQFPSAQPDLLDDGTILMTVPHGILSDVKRVMVDEVGTKNCKVMYQDEPERKKGEWIPCSERLPEVHRSILIATSQGYVAEGEYDGMYDGRHAWVQYRWSSTLLDDEVVAWMPLPEPYRGES